MSIQGIIVTIMVAAAILYAAIVLVRKRRAFSTKHGCDDDCGCNGAAKKLTS